MSIHKVSVARNRNIYDRAILSSPHYLIQFYYLCNYLTVRTTAALFHLSLYIYSILAICLLWTDFYYTVFT